jgi:hypothetical protein
MAADKKEGWSGRYWILKNMPEGAGKRAVLAMMRPFLGPEPVWYTPGAEDAPEELPDLTVENPGVPAKIRLALMVGHNSVSPGAWLKPPISESEFVFWNRVVDIAVSEGIPGVEMRKFNRHYTRRGYAAEIAAAYEELNRWRPHLSKECHFNGGDGDYSFVLVGKGRETDARVAAAGQKVWAKRLGFRSLGVRERTKGERGGRSLFAADCPQSLGEEFFGDNLHHAKRIAELGHEGVALILIESLKAQIEELYRVSPTA